MGLALAAFMMQPAAVQAKAKKEAKVVKQLVVLHTNDTHSCVMPINPNLADTATANRGGFLRRVAMISRSVRRIPTCCSLTVAISHRVHLITLFSREMWK